MDRRSEDRRPCNLDARLTGLKNGDTGSGQILNISKSGICVVSALPFERGDVVQVEMGENRMFGHIAYCEPEAQLYRCGMEIVQVLVGGSQISRLLATILTDSIPEDTQTEPSEIRLG